MATRTEIVVAARKYLGFPMRHQGRLSALDCVGLVLAVAEDLELVDIRGVPIRRNDYLQYGPQPVNAFVHDECARRLLACPTPIGPGDVLTLRVPLIPCHVAIVSEIPGQGLGIIHAYAESQNVVEHRLDEAWRNRIVGAFSFPGVT